MKDPAANSIDPMPPAFRAAHIIATHGEEVGEFDGSPEGEVVWQEDGDTVTFTPDGWLVWVGGEAAASYRRRMRATPALLAELRGRPK